MGLNLVEKQFDTVSEFMHIVHCIPRHNGRSNNPPMADAPPDLVNWADVQAGFRMVPDLPGMVQVSASLHSIRC